MADFTTVSVPELPPATITDSSEFPHSVGDILSKCTGLDIKNYLQSLVGYAPYEIKCLRPPGDGTAYVSEHFDTSATSLNGLGLVGGIWEGWAICNGNNGTDNLDGQTLIGFGANYAIIGEFTGSEEVTLTINQIPAHSHDITLYNASPSPGNTINSLELGDPNNPGTYTTNSRGGGLPHNNMQPSMVVLVIIKLP